MPHQIGRQIERGQQARGIGYPLPGNIVSSTMIGGGSNDLQAERDIDSMVHV